MAASGGTPASCGGALYPDVSVPLSLMPEGVVFRFWAFQNFFVSHGKFRWSQLDRVLAIAKAHGDKVIPVLGNQYSYCDGRTKTLPWYQQGYRTTTGRHDLVTYRSYVKAITKRYAGNSTIAMWQLVNEGQAINGDGTCTESKALRALAEFSKDVGGLAHRVDPTHLVSLGTVAGYSGSGRQWCGARNGHYQTLMASPGNDVCDYHDYGYPAEPMGMPVGPNLESATHMCHATGKPLMVAEIGIYANNDSALIDRATQLHAKIAAQLDSGVVGTLLWTWAVKPQYVISESPSNYSIFPGDPALDAIRYISGSP